MKQVIRKTGQGLLALAVALCLGAAGPAALAAVELNPYTAVNDYANILSIDRIFA